MTSKATIDLLGGLIPAERIAAPAQPEPLTPLLSLVQQVRVSASTIEWLFEGDLPEAGIVVEGMPKPEAVVGPALRTVHLGTVAVQVPYSRDVAEDGTAMVDLLRKRLIRGLLARREETASAVLIADQNIPETPNDNNDLAGGVARAIGTVQLAGYSTTGIVVNPLDYSSLDLVVLGGGTGEGVGIRIVPAASVPRGIAFVGDFGLGMVELLRDDVQVHVTDSHDGNFVSNVLVALVEQRVKPIVHQPQALTWVAGAVVE